MTRQDFAQPEGVAFIKAPKRNSVSANAPVGALVAEVIDVGAPRRCRSSTPRPAPVTRSPSPMCAVSRKPSQLAGPSEIFIVADHTGDAEMIATDLLAQPSMTCAPA